MSKPAPHDPVEPGPHTTDGDTAQQGLIAVDAISRLLITSNFDLDLLLDEVVRTTVVQMGVKAGALRLLNVSTGTLYLKAVYGLSNTFLEVGPAFETESRFQRLIRNGGVLEILNLSDETDLHFSEAALAEGICSLLAVELCRDGHPIGALSIYTESQHQFTDTEIRTFRAIANQASVAVQLAHLHRERLETGWLERELELAADIQTRNLPKQMPTLPGVQIAGWNQSLNQIGGDFYDLISLPNGNLGLAIGDVSGKGIPAALLMFATRTALRSYVEYEYAISEVMHRVNRTLFKDTLAEQFATLFYGVLHLTSRRFTYVNASHDPPLLFRGDELLTLEVGGLAVGITADQSYEEASIQLQPGDLLLLYTDGFTDAFDVNDEFFGLEGLLDGIQAHRHQSPEEIIRALVEAVTTFAEGSPYGDDRTAVVLKFD